MAKAHRSWSTHVSLGTVNQSLSRWTVFQQHSSIASPFIGVGKFSKLFFNLSTLSHRSELTARSLDDQDHDPARCILWQQSTVSDASFGFPDAKSVSLRSACYDRSPLGRNHLQVHLTQSLWPFTRSLKADTHCAGTISEEFPETPSPRPRSKGSSSVEKKRQSPECVFLHVSPGKTSNDLTPSEALLPRGTCLSWRRQIPQSGAESQWIAVWKLLYQVQHSGWYVSRLQTIRYDRSGVGWSAFEKAGIAWQRPPSSPRLGYFPGPRRVR